jgi:hypothetical protein
MALFTLYGAVINNHFRYDGIVFADALFILIQADPNTGSSAPVRRLVLCRHVFLAMFWDCMEALGRIKAGSVSSSERARVRSDLYTARRTLTEECVYQCLTVTSLSGGKEGVYKHKTTRLIAMEASCS